MKSKLIANLSRFNTRHVQRTVFQYLVATILIVTVLSIYAGMSWITGSVITFAGVPFIIAFAARPRLQKKHRIKKIVRAVQMRMPFWWRARKNYRIWRRPDRQLWPDPRRSENLGLSRYEYSLQSQHGEDGIIRYLFSEIGFSNRHFIEFGFGAAQSNCLRLIMHERFCGVFIDGSEEQCRLLDACTGHFGIEGVSAERQFLDVDNLEETIRRGNPPHDLDLLSIDVDGNDYWFWQRIDFLQPRIVIIEYNAMLGPELSLTIPYDDEFNVYTTSHSAAGNFWGASLSALEKLGRQKNYRLVGCDSTGVNAFFLRADIPAERIPTLSAAQAYYPYMNWLERGISSEDQLALALEQPYVQV
jgi:hypothetical protein